MRTIKRTTQFKKDYKREMKGKHKSTLQADIIGILENLASDSPLKSKHYDHALSNNWKDHRDCHIKPDLVMIYRKIDNDLQLVRLGSHSELGL